MNTLSTVLIAVVFFVLGGVIIGIIWYFQGVSKRARGGDGDKTTPEVDPNLEEIAHLMRHLETQELVVEMNGGTYSSYHQLSPAQQRRLTFTSTVLSKWLAEPAPEPAPEEAPASTSQEEVPETPAQIETDTSEQKSVYIPPFITEAEEEVKPVSTNLPDVVGGMLNPTPKPTPAFKSIAMQINDILQARMVGTELESRGITLQDAPDRGVMVTLDGKQYSGVTDVPDEEVRNAIRAAVQEWEAKK